MVSDECSTTRYKRNSSPWSGSIGAQRYKQGEAEQALRRLIVYYSERGSSAPTRQGRYSANPGPYESFEHAIELYEALDVPVIK